MTPLQQLTIDILKSNIIDEIKCDVIIFNEPYTIEYYDLLLTKFYIEHKNDLGDFQEFYKIINDGLVMVLYALDEFNNLDMTALGYYSTICTIICGCSLHSLKAILNL